MKKLVKASNFQELVKKNLEKIKNENEKKEKVKNEKWKQKEKEKILIDLNLCKNSKLNKIKLYSENENINDLYLFNEKWKLNKNIKEKINEYWKIKNDFEKLLKASNKKDIEKLKDYKLKLKTFENDKNLKMIIEYLKINSFKSKDILKDIEYENIKKDYILNLCNWKKVKKLNKLNIEKNINKKIKCNYWKFIYMKNEKENENIFWKSENFNINFINNLNNKFIIEKININEYEKVKDLNLNDKMKKWKNNLEYIYNLLNDKTILKNTYKKEWISIKDKINNDYNYIINSSNRIYNKYLKVYKKENENIKEKILNLYSDKLKNINENENILNDKLKNYNLENTKINQKINRKREYFKNEYWIYYMDFLFNNIYNKYKKWFVWII